MRQCSGVQRLTVLTAALLLVSTLVAAQAPSATEQQEYQAAVAKPRGPEQFSALEKFLAAHPQSRLKLDALQLMVWDARTSATVADLEYWTEQLLRLSSDNPLAAAIVIQRSLPISSENPVNRAKRSLPALERFDRPEGLSHDDFAEMKSFATATLNGVVGYSYFEQKDLIAARPYLRKAVELDPRNAQYTYTLALCDLQSANPDQAEGYTMLARAVNLTKGTPAGDRLAAFARENFQQAGGSSENWDKYLAATVPPAPPTNEAPSVVANSTPAAAATPSPQPTAGTAPSTGLPTNVPATGAVTNSVAKNSPPSNPAGSANPAGPATVSSATKPSVGANTTNTVVGTSGIAKSVPPTTTNSATAATNPPPSATTPAYARPSNAANSSVAEASRPVAPAAPREPIFIASNTAGPPIVPHYSTVPPVPTNPEPDRPLRVFPPRPARHIAPGSPVSVGVLIQASLADRVNRRPVVFTLSDLIRHLREKDEAFIMSFSRGVVFQEDLTSNSKSLENAMDSIAPTPGAAMYDAVTFAAGHLDRVARNPNRVLLVIAAEGDRDSTVSPLELSSEINLSGVTIYCIGVGVVTTADQNRLESLAASTGGRAIFISDLSHFRDATRTIAQGLGIGFR